MAKEKGSRHGSEAFQHYYAQLYTDRWEVLKASLLVDRVPIRYTEGLVQPYYLDEASVIAARMLGVQDGDHVLDMCAAPGGKSLILASALRTSGSLVSNDRSATRRGRLKQVLEDHLPQEIRMRVAVTGHDATRWSLYKKDQYDRILLDAPCSSERHVLVDQKALSIWSPSRPRHLAIQQFAMLAAALDAVKIGGYILYSTCSINPIENELVIEKLYTKRSGRFVEETCEADFTQRLDHGSIILPDAAEGRGPLYFCLIRRTA